MSDGTTIESAGTAPTGPLPQSAPSPNGRSAAAAAPVDVEAVLAAAGRSNRRRWPLVLLGAAVGGAATWAAASGLDGSDGGTPTEQASLSLATAEVEVRDLLEEIEWSGILGYGDPVGVAGSGGIVTWASEPGTTVERGDVVAAVDGDPVVVLYGDTPMWRTLSQGDEGRDVLQLEANLASLGYDPDATVDIDGDFTANTQAMVERWQEDLGREVTGVVEPGDAIVVEGPSSVTSVADVGSTATGQLASLAPRRAVTDVVASIGGTVDQLAPIGTAIEPGTVLYRIDEVPVVAITADDEPAEALLDETFTVLELEQALADSGHDPDGEMTVDGVVTSATTAAMERWQAAAGLPVTGETDAGFYHPVPAGQAVDGHVIAAGDPVTTGGPILTTSVSRLSVAVTVEVSEADEFAVDQGVTIELADETTAEGVVAEIGPVTQATDPQGSPTVTVVIGVVTGSDQSLIEGPVTVVGIGEEILGAMVIPVRALVALAEGGFAVEKVIDGGQTRLIAVELGTFDDGMVEVLVGDLSPGDLSPGDLSPGDLSPGDLSPGDIVTVPR